MIAITLQEFYDSIVPFVILLAIALPQAAAVVRYTGCPHSLLSEIAQEGIFCDIYLSKSWLEKLS
jgi:hypothetical protein